ncbi:MAG: VWA domain-containing protein, partial [Bacteroidota bacterium]
MDTTQLLTEYSPAYLILCILAGIAYAYLLYTKDAPWNRQVNWLLAGTRAVLVTLVALLLLGIFVRQTKNRYEDPTWVIATDDSQSLPLLNDSSEVTKVYEELISMQAQLGEKGFQVDYRNLSEQEKPTFSHPSTNLSSFLQEIESDYEGTNLAGVVLFSDGIFNLGASPNFSPYNFKLHTLGIGDTVPRRDVNLRSVKANRLSYLGNRFPIIAEVSQNGFSGREVVVSLSQNGALVDRKTIQFGADERALKEVRFLAEAKKEGVQRFVVQVSSLEGEFTIINNVRNTYVEVLDSKQKILIAASAPHPDIKALRAAIEQNENYEVDLAIPNIFLLKPTEKYDLIIFHQMPSPRAQVLFRELRERKTPKAYVVAQGTDLNSFNSLNLGISIQQLGRQQDRVAPVYNNSFDKFLFDEERKEVFQEYPPVAVPFGNYKVSGAAQVLLYQRVGSITTDNPLLLVDESGEQKVGVFVGDGLWRWRLQEYALEQEQLSFDELVEKWVQYLVARDDKRRFRVRTTDAEFSTSESVDFEVEAYNEIYEPITGQTIDLRIKNEDGESRPYTFVNTTPNFKYSLRGLPEGVYTYEARTQLSSETQVSTGQFSVRALQLEALNTTADFQLLR